RHPKRPLLCQKSRRLPTGRKVARRSTARTQRLETTAGSCKSFGREFYPSVTSQISLCIGSGNRVLPNQLRVQGFSLGLSPASTRSQVKGNCAFSFGLGSLRHMIPPRAGYGQVAMLVATCLAAVSL